MLGGYNEDGFVPSYLAQYEINAVEDKQGLNDAAPGMPGVKRNFVSFEGVFNKPPGLGLGLIKKTS